VCRPWKIGDDAKEMIKIVKEVRDIPCAVGFGISTPEQAQMAGFSDGVIVGSAIVKIIAQYGAECIPYVEEYVRKMKIFCTLLNILNVGNNFDEYGSVYQGL